MVGLGSSGVGRFEIRSGFKSLGLGLGLENGVYECFGDRMF